MNVFTTGLLAFLIALALTPAVRWLACGLNIMDHPGTRKVHRKPVPRLGGFAVYMAWLISLTLSTSFSTEFLVNFQVRGIVVVGLLVVLFGMIDDWKDLGGEEKLFAQLIMASLVFLTGLRIELISNPLGGVIIFPWPLSYLLTVLWIIGMMNAMNLIDGLDGLAPGIAVITSFGLGATALFLGNPLPGFILAALGGACAGFLVYNFHPAKIFLGDSGSQFLGYMFATTALVSQQYKAATAVSLLIPICALSIPIYDTGLAFFRRFREGRPVFVGDKFHLHHRLLKMGLTQRQAVLFFYLVAVYLNCLAFLFILIPEQYAVLLLALLGLGVVLAMQVLRFVELKLRERVKRKVRRLKRAAQ